VQTCALPISGVLFGDAPARLADDEHDLAFVVELLRLERAQDRRAMADETLARSHEHARVTRGFLLVLVFRVAVTVVDADADYLAVIGQSRQPPYGVRRGVALMLPA